MPIKQYTYCVRAAADYADPDAYVSALATSDIWGDAQDAGILYSRVDDLRRIYTAYHRPVREIAAAAGLSPRKLAERFCVPYRSMENWCTGVSECPPYTRLMMQE